MLVYKLRIIIKRVMKHGLYDVKNEELVKQENIGINYYRTYEDRLCLVLVFIKQSNYQ